MPGSPPPPPAERPQRPARTLRAPAAGSRWVAGAQRRYRGSTPQRFLLRLKEVDFATTATLIGASALLSALPFVILVDALVADRRVEDDLTRHMGLDQQAARIVDGLFSNPSLQSVPAVVLALLFSLAGMIGLAGMVERTYEQAFALPHRRGRGRPGRLLLWVVLLCGWFALDSGIGAATHALPGGRVVDAVAVLLVATGFFWLSMRLLLGRALPPRELLVPAEVSALFWLTLQVLASLYFSPTIVNDSRLYGPVGVVFSLLTWFTAIAAVIVLGAVAGEVWQHRRRGAPAAGEGVAGEGVAEEEPAPELVPAEGDARQAEVRTPAHPAEAEVAPVPGPAEEPAPAAPGQAPSTVPPAGG